MAVSEDSKMTVSEDSKMTVSENSTMTVSENSKMTVSEIFSTHFIGCDCIVCCKCRKKLLISAMKCRM
jgi:hypothetical protein